MLSFVLVAACSFVLKNFVGCIYARGIYPILHGTPVLIGDSGCLATTVVCRSFARIQVQTIQLFLCVTLSTLGHQADTGGYRFTVLKEYSIRW